MEPVTLGLTILLGILVIRYLLRRNLDKLEKLGVLHEKPWPILGNVGPMLLRRCHFTEMINKVYRINEDAEYVGFYELNEPVILIRSRELIKSIAVKNFDHFTDHRGFVGPEEDSLFAKNLLGLRGDKWREIRNLLSPAFTSNKMKSMFKLMLSCGHNFVDNLADSSLVKSGVLDTKEAFTRYTNDVIATCAFGVSVDSVKDPNNDFYKLGREATNFTGIRVIVSFLTRHFPKVAKLFGAKIISPKVEAFFETVVRETIETRDRDGIIRPDMIQLMMESRGKKMGSGPELTIRDMTAQAFIFFFGGFESTATIMCFVAFEVAINSEVQRKLQEEVDQVLREADGHLTYEVVNEMHYLDAVLNETLRLYPVLPLIDRVCVKTFELPPALPGLKPVIVEPGQMVTFPAFSMHRDPKYFENPDKFDPERFMGTRKNDVDPYAYFPFGLGPRMCIGNRFALLEIKVLIICLLEKFELQPSPTMTLPMRFDKSSFSLIPRSGLPLKIKSRDTFLGK